MPSLVAEIGEVLETHMKKIGLIKMKNLVKLSIGLQGAAIEAQAANADNADPGDFRPPGAQLCNKCNASGCPNGWVHDPLKLRR